MHNHRLSIILCISLLGSAAQSALAAAGAPVQQQAYAVSAVAAGTASSLARTTQLSLVNEQLQQYGQSFEQLTVQVTPETASRLHVKVAPTGQQLWEVPESIVPRPGSEPGLSSSSLQYAVELSQPGQPFGLTVNRKSNGQPIFDTNGHRFIFKDQYIELTTNVPEDADLYGLGEVSLPTGLLLPRDGTVITMWARDLASAMPYVNLYGSHPFYLQINRDGSSHGVLFLNSNGMDVSLNKTSLTYKVIGGLVDLYFFTGPTPEEVIRQYHQVIGAPAMTPYWSLGFHQTRWGYQNISVLEEVVANYTAVDLPLEVVWSDIEYMSTRFWTMEFDEHRYPAAKMKSFVEGLHEQGQHWVAIQDAGVAADKGYKAYEEGTRDRVWITDHKGKDYLGQVWPGKTVYPDYLDNANTSRWLVDNLQHMYDKVPYDGLWLDMNEASNFCSGMQCKPNRRNKTATYWLEVETPRDYNINELIPLRTTCQMSCEEPAADNKWESPPYNIQNFDNTGMRENRQAGLGWKTIAPSALHANGAREYDAHNLYGTAMALEHHAAVEKITGKRPFLLTRSTFPGAGRFTAHWTGDNGVNWENLYMSIAGIINTNMWGMPMVGADICGFADMAFKEGGSPDVIPESSLRELCNRWASLGAFYPFSRNHYAYFTRSHEYYQWPDVAAAAKKAYSLRYQLLSYIYSGFFLAHVKGGTVARPLLFTDPSDVDARNATAQWMMGEALLVSPVVTEATTTIKPHFTAGAWYNAWDNTRMTLSKGQAVELEVPLGDIAVHYRGGAVIPTQPYAKVTRDIRLAPVTLLVTLPAEPAGKSEAAGPLAPYAHEEVCAAAIEENEGQLVSCGLLYMDRGDDIQVSADNTVQVWYTAVSSADGRSGTLSSTIKAHAGDAAGKLRIAAVHILGVPAAEGTAVPAASINGRPLAAAFDETAGVLKISGIELLVGEPLDITWTLGSFSG
ncbi:hypothetical protein OEZ85_004970 [Tetradesmus obliquus]|uniref:Maltase n=1 Tax=Tetradesmus obliquus TaxID=3088 RepID=A0ABY8UJW3_TETOB|nr:hypothetical protein OEZ85_004970 [Tetradesmus obliquus]